MSKGGVIIRLIDVALIILFGFIVISDLKIRSQIKLPSSTEETESIRERKIVFVEILRDGSFHLKEDNGLGQRISSLKLLETEIVDKYDQYQRQNIEMVVLIEPDPETPIQMTVDVLDLCEKHKILKNIGYPSLQL